MDPLWSDFEAYIMINTNDGATPKSFITLLEGLGLGLEDTPTLY